MKIPSDAKIDEFKIETRKISYLTKKQAYKSRRSFVQDDIKMPTDQRNDLFLISSRAINIRGKMSFGKPELDDGVVNLLIKQVNEIVGIFKLIRHT